MSWFEALADHMGPAYLRYSFTKGTEREVDALIDILGLTPGERVLDIGCGPGRHALALAERGYDVVGVDISERFVDLANEAARQIAGESAGSASFVVVDARDLADLLDRPDAVTRSDIAGLAGSFDAVISLCQGAFGLSGGDGARMELPDRELDESIMGGMALMLRPGGCLALSAFSAYFQVKFLEDGDDFDALNGVNRETTEVRDDAGVRLEADLWTTCYTPRELRLLTRCAGLEPLDVWSVTPGNYERRPPNTDSPEFLLLATKPRENS